MSEKIVDMSHHHFSKIKNLLLEMERKKIKNNKEINK